MNEKRREYKSLNYADCEHSQKNILYMIMTKRKIEQKKLQRKNIEFFINNYTVSNTAAKFSKNARSLHICMRI